MQVRGVILVDFLVILPITKYPF